MDDLANKNLRDRSKINLRENLEVKYWCRELGIDKARLRQLIEKVGNSAATVRKELGQARVS